MATDFNVNALTSSGGFKPTTKDTPIDIRSRVATETDIQDIPNPYIGMLIYVLDTGKRFEVLSLKEVTSGMTKVSKVDQYKEFGISENGTAGEDGATFTPYVDAEGNLSWTNDKELANPETVNIKGERGLRGPAGEDGIGIESIVQTTASSTDGGNNVFTITLTDGNQTTFNVKNGSKGSQGEQGPQGSTGPRGEQGPQGQTGPEGPEGPEGPQGPKGATGPEGPQGPKGADGADGADATITNVTASVNSSVGTPSVTVTMGGTATARTIDFSFSNLKGAKGDQGEQGEQGPKGNTGPEGPEGPQGPRGLTGPEGPEGPQGPKGNTGSEGPQGPQGLTGPEGPQGPKPVKGTDYFTDSDKSDMVDQVIASMPKYIPAVLTSEFYGSTLPSSGTPGRIFFLLKSS